MNAIISEEYSKLNETQKAKFDQLVALQTQGNPGQGIYSDAAYEQILKWVKAMGE